MKTKKALVVTSSYNPPYYVNVQSVVEALRRKKWEVTTLRFENNRIWRQINRFFDMRVYSRYAKRSLESFYVPAQPKQPKRITLFFCNFVARLLFLFITMFRMEKPSIIVVLADQPLPCKIAVFIGKLAHIPSLRLVFTGTVPRNNPQSIFYTDKIAVSGEFAKDVLTKLGVDGKRIVVTGRL